MPIIQSGSKKAVGENISREMKSGKPQKQAIAIAYSVQKKNKRKKMADGGELSAADEKRPMPDNEYHDREETSREKFKLQDQMDSLTKEKLPMPSFKEHDQEQLDEVNVHKEGPQSLNWKNAIRESIDNAETPEEFAMLMSQGGHIPEYHQVDRQDMLPDMEEDDDRDLDMVGDIMKKQKLNKYADGGEVDLDENAMEQPNYYYERNEDDVLKENYDEDMDGVDQPMDSNEHSDELSDEDENSDDEISKIRHRMKSRKAR